jgi:hypothetical protein
VDLGAVLRADAEVAEAEPYKVTAPLCRIVWSRRVAADVSHGAAGCGAWVPRRQAARAGREAGRQTVSGAEGNRSSEPRSAAKKQLGTEVKWQWGKRGVVGRAESQRQRGSGAAGQRGSGAAGQRGSGAG